jgi:cytoskeletal protein CcmA (bactofilin family)
MKYLLPFFIIVVLLVPVVSHAAVFSASNSYTLRQGDVVNEDLYAAGVNVTAVGNVKGDASLVGANVFVGDSISDSAFLIGGTVDVIGDIGKNLRIMSGKTIFHGTVGHDLVVASGNFQILPQSTITGDVAMAVANAVIDGTIKGDVKGVFGSLVINGTVLGSVKVTADSITIGPNAHIVGNFDYSSSQSANIDKLATINGQVTYTNVDTRSRFERLLPTVWGTWIFIKFIILLVSALVIQGVFRSISQVFVRTAVEDSLWCLVRGFVTVVATPLALAVLFLTFVGIPFVILGLSLYTSFLVLAYLFSPIVLGGLLTKLFWRNHDMIINWKSIVLGVCAFMILSPLGWFGTALQAILFLVTLGSLYKVLLGRFARARE